jgi:hypothetical protein
MFTAIPPTKRTRRTARCCAEQTLKSVLRYLPLCVTNEMCSMLTGIIEQKCTKSVAIRK